MATKATISTAKKSAKSAKKPTRKAAQTGKKTANKAKKMAVSELKDLKNSVLNELNALEKSAEKGADRIKEASSKAAGKLEEKAQSAVQVPLAPSRFEEALAPAMTRQALRQCTKEYALKGALGLLLLALIALFFITGQKQETPQTVAKQAVAAIQEQDVAAFDHLVAIENVAQSVVDQVFQVSPAVNDDVQQRLMDVVRPGLVEQLQTHMRVWVAKGPVGLQAEAGILPQLLEEAGADAVISHFGEVVMEEDQAQVTLDVNNPTWDVSAPVTLQLMQENDAWRVVGVTGVQEALRTFVAAHKVYADNRAAAIKAQLEAILVVEELEKAAGLSDFDAGKGVLLSAVLRNTSSRDIRSATLNIVFKDAAGQPMKSFIVEDTDGIPTGETLEKTWTLLVDPTKKPESHIYALPQHSLVIEVRAQEMIFEDGSSLKLPLAR